MVAAALAMRWSVSGLWNNAGFLEIASAISTLILIAGATIEYWVQLKQLAFQMLKVLRFWNLPYERPVLRKLAFHSIGPILVVIGIAGELIFETRTFIVEDRETAVLRKEAGDAAKSAHDAAADAKQAKGDAGESKTKAEGADALAGGAQQKAIAAELKAEAVAKLADEVKSELATTEYLVSARQIDDPNTLTEQLKQFKGRGVDFWSNASDPEAYTMCEELVSLSRAAGVTPVPQCGGWTPFGRPATGITVWGPDDNENLLLAQIIGSAMHSVSTTGTWKGLFPGAPVPHSVDPLNPIVFVGSKPLFIIRETAQTRDAEKKATAIKQQRKQPDKP